MTAEKQDGRPILEQDRTGDNFLGVFRTGDNFLRKNIGEKLDGRDKCLPEKLDGRNEFFLGGRGRSKYRPSLYTGEGVFNYSGL